MNPTEISLGFKEDIADYFESYQPQAILETGLYHGMGSTRTICELIRDLPIKNAEFYSIECSETNINIAKENLKHGDLLKYVTIISGLSIPKRLMPDEHDINNTIAIAVLSKAKADHLDDPKNAAFHYLKETEVYEKDDRIDDVMKIFRNQMDFILLDSGGHMGKIEFDYVISKLKSPCAIALDDTQHCKHLESAKFIYEDPRFEVLYDSDEKNGSLIAQFIP